MAIGKMLMAMMVSGSLGWLACTDGTRPSAPASSSSSSNSSDSSNTGSAGEAPPATPPGGDWGARGGHGRHYDPATVETVRGQVVRVERAAPTRGSAGGVHVILRSDDGGTIAAHLGPAWFVDDQDFAIQEGDTLEVTGSRVTIDGAPAIIARSVARGDDELVLRDEAGIPVWSGAGRRGRR